MRMRFWNVPGGSIVVPSGTGGGSGMSGSSEVAFGDRGDGTFARFCGGQPGLVADQPGCWPIAAICFTNSAMSA
jgi:hypothetical protein